MKFRIVSAVALAAAAAGALFACKSSDNGGTAGACQSYGSALVAYQERCSGTIDPSRQSDLAARYSQLCTGALSLPGIPDLSAQLNTCASNLSNASCNENVDQIDGCDIQTNGTLADGAACVISEECQSGDCTITGGTSADGGTTLCGTCTPAIPDGADCSNGNCVAGDVCNFNDSSDGGFSAVCVKKPAPGGVGATCDTTSACAGPNHCDFSGGTSGSGTCTAPVASGGACTQNADCASGLVCSGQSARTCGQPVAEGGTCSGNDCAPGLACDFSSLKCAKITFAAAGAGCDDNTVRCSHGNCVMQAQPGGGTGGGTGGGGSLSGTCPTIIADGQPCSGNNGTSQCDDYASCYNGKCSLVPAACK